MLFYAFYLYLSDEVKANKMQIKIFYLLILFLGHKVYGQADTLNKFNVNNKKLVTGKFFWT